MFISSYIGGIDEHVFKGTTASDKVVFKRGFKKGELSKEVKGGRNKPAKPADPPVDCNTNDFCLKELKTNMMTAAVVDNFNSLLRAKSTAEEAKEHALRVAINVGVKLNPSGIEAAAENRLSLEKMFRESAYWIVKEKLAGKFVKVINHLGADIADFDVLSSDVLKRFGRAAVALAHFSLVYSKGKMLLTDIQGAKNTVTDCQIQTRGDCKVQGHYGNVGEEAFVNFLLDHRCNFLCDRLNLGYVTDFISLPTEKEAVMVTRSSGEQKKRKNTAEEEVEIVSPTSSAPKRFKSETTEQGTPVTSSLIEASMVESAKTPIVIESTDSPVKARRGHSTAPAQTQNFKSGFGGLALLRVAAADADTEEESE